MVHPSGDPQGVFLSGGGGLVVPILLVAVLVLCFGEREQRLRRILEMLPFSLLAALSFLVPYYLLGTFLGPEFASIVGAIAGMFLTVLAARFHILVPKHCWRFRKRSLAPHRIWGSHPPLVNFYWLGRPIWSSPCCSLSPVWTPSG